MKNHIGLPFFLLFLLSITPTDAISARRFYPPANSNANAELEKLLKAISNTFSFEPTEKIEDYFLESFKFIGCQEDFDRKAFMAYVMNFKGLVPYPHKKTLVKLLGEFGILSMEFEISYKLDGRLVEQKYTAFADDSVSGGYKLYRIERKNCPG